MKRSGPVTKAPPYSILAEKSMLGAVLREPALLDEIAPLLPGPEAFFRPEHASVYGALLEVAAPESLSSDDLIETIAGRDPARHDAVKVELLAMVREAPDADAAVDAARTVADKAVLRRLIAAATAIIHDAYYVDDAVPAIVRSAAERIDAVVADTPSPDDEVD